MKKVILLFLFLCVFENGSVRSQSDTSAISTDESRVHVVGLDIGSSKIYKSVATSNSKYSSIYYNYTNRKHFTFSIATYNFYDGGAKLDEVDLGIGWDKKLSKKYFFGIGYTYMGYNKESTQLSSSLNNVLSIYFKRKGTWLRSKLLFDYSFGTSDRDFSIVYANYHPFEKEFNENNYLVFTPRINIAFGTVNYLKTGLTKRAKDQIKKGNISDADFNTRFALNALEFSLPLAYTYKKFTIELSYKLAIPLNQPKLKELQTSPTSAALLSMYFTFEKD